VKVEVIQILSLEPEDRQRLNSHALQRFDNWRNPILSEARQLRRLSIEQIRADLDAYLDDNERDEFAKCSADITTWLSGCMDTGDRYFPYAYDTEVIAPMGRVESLIRRAFQKAEAERRRKEYEDRWCAAHIYLDPPTDDAKRYLDDNELHEFRLAMAKAIEAYLEKGTAYLVDLRTTEYASWLEKIQERKKEEARRVQASRAASEYNHRLNQEIRELASRLDHDPRDLASYFRAKNQDKRHTKHRFDHTLSGEDQMNLDTALVRAANSRLEQLLSSDLRCFVNLPSRYYRLYFPLPVANYRFEKVPCITIGFDIFAAAYAEVWLEPGKKSINGYEFALPLMEEKNDVILLEKPKLLAYHHVTLTPEDLGGYVSWKCIPLILLKGLLNGETRPDGCTISAPSGSVTTYRVRGFEEEVDAPDEFAKYLNGIGSIDEMVGMGIMTEKVGNIIRAALSEMEVERRAPTGVRTAEKRGSKKESAFRLFDEGKRPSDPEVKALSIKPTTVYRYHQAWKKACSRG